VRIADLWGPLPRKTVIPICFIEGLVIRLLGGFFLSRVGNVITFSSTTSTAGQFLRPVLSPLLANASRPGHRGKWSA
jgi:hypothetical protein